MCYIAADDTAGGHGLVEWTRAHCGTRVPVRTLSRPDASSLDCSKAKRLLGWAPKFTWRDFLGADGKLLSSHPK